MKPKISIRNGLKDNKNTFQTKILDSINDDKRISDKNNNWKVLGKAYNQFVFISVRIKNIYYFLTTISNCFQII